MMCICASSRNKANTTRLTSNKIASYVCTRRRLQSRRNQSIFQFIFHCWLLSLSVHSFCTSTDTRSCAASLFTFLCTKSQMHKSTLYKRCFCAASSPSGGCNDRKGIAQRRAQTYNPTGYRKSRHLFYDELLEVKLRTKQRQTSKRPHPKNARKC